MMEKSLVHLLRRLVTEKELADAVNDVRIFLREERAPMDKRELLTVIRRTSRGGSVVVPLIIGCGLEEQLQQSLLLSHVEDALEEMQSLLHSCSTMYSASETNVKLVTPLLDMLLTVSLLFILGYGDGRADERQCETVLEEMERLSYCSGILSSSGRLLLEDYVVKARSGAKVNIYERFLYLPYELDERQLNSRTGRAILNTVEQVLHQQQYAAASNRISNDDMIPAFHEIELSTIIERMWDLVRHVRDLICCHCSSSVKCYHMGKKLIVSSRSEKDSATTPLIDLVLNAASLEKYLKSKPPCTESLKIVEPLKSGNLENMNDASATDQLIAILESRPAHMYIESELLQRVFDELSAQEDLQILKISAAFLLGSQLRSRCRIYNGNDQTKSHFERKVQRVFNSLTDETNEREHMLQLMVLAALCPTRVIQEIVRGAQESSLHHSFYIRVLHSSPLLLDWKEPAIGNSSTDLLFIYELQKMILAITRDSSAFIKRSHYVVEFLCAMSGTSSTASIENDALSISFEDILRDVLIPVHKILNARVHDESEATMEEQNLEWKSQYFAFVRLMLQQYRLSSSQIVIDASFLHALFDMAISSYSEAERRLSQRALKLKETLLLLVNDIQEVLIVLRERLSFSISDSQCELLDILMLTLVAPRAAFQRFRFLHTGDNGVCLFSDNLEEFSYANLEKLHHEDIKRLIQMLLWRLLWNELCSAETVITIQSPQTSQMGRILDSIGSLEIELGGDSMRRVYGATMIQNQVTKVMLICGKTLFPLLANGVIASLLNYDAENLIQQEVNCGNCVSETLSTHAVLWDIQDCLPFVMSPCHHLVKYILRCWTILILGNEMHPTDAMIELLRHILTICEQAITSSQSSPPGLLYCFQSVCYLFVVSVRASFCVLENWTTAQNQLEVSLLRILHLLAQSHIESEEQAHVCQEFVAHWLAMLPSTSFFLVTSFLITKPKDSNAATRS